MTATATLTDRVTGRLIDLRLATAAREWVPRFSQAALQGAFSSWWRSPGTSGCRRAMSLSRRMKPRRSSTLCPAVHVGPPTPGRINYA